MVLFSDPLNGYLGALVSIFGVIHYWVILSKRYRVAARWDELIVLNSQTGEIQEPPLKGSTRGVIIPWGEVVFAPEEEGRALLRAKKYFVTKMNAALGAAPKSGD